MTEGRLAKHSARVIVRPVAALLCSLLIACVPLYAQPAELSPGDWIEIQTGQVPGLAGRYQVDQDGFIDFPVVGSLAVKGTSLQALRQQLQDALARKGYQRPTDLDVDVSAAPALGAAVAAAVAEGPRPLQTGDVLAIAVAGEPTISGQYTVQPPGAIVLPMVGEVQAAGITVQELTGVLTRRLGRYVVEPVVRVTLVSAIPRLVHIVGQVGRPGSYPLEQTPTVLALLAAGGGVLPTGNLAEVVLFRDGKPQKLCPEGLLPGDILPQDVALQRGDSLVIPGWQDPVYVVGAVNAPGPKLARSAASLSEAIVVAGGVTAEADLNGTYILRKGQRFDVDLEALLERGEGSADVPLAPGNAVVVPTTVKQVYVVGQVPQPGIYSSEVANTLLDLWSLVGSALPDADLHNCTVLRGQETISVDIEALVNQGDMSQNIALQPGDKLIVSKILERVYILGQVVRPGAYPIKEGDTLMDILGKAGGPTVMADTGKMALMRRKSAEAGPGARPTRPSRTREQPQVRGRPASEQPAFGLDKLRRQRDRRGEPAPARPEEEQLGFEEQISLRILAAAEWQDVAMRPRPGDVIYIPARRERLTTTDYLRILLNIVPALLIR